MDGHKNPLAIAISGLNYPPREAMEAHAQRVEAAGFFDYLWTSDQLVLTVPRSIWTEDMVGPAARHDIDAWMDAFISATVQGMQLEKTRVGIAVIDALRRPPAVLAQSLLSLDHVVGGGSFFVLGGGELKQCAPYGTVRDKPVGRLEDAVRFCKLLWNSQDPVTAEGKVSNLDRAVLALPPVDGKAPGAWVAGSSPKTLEIAGKHADGWIMWAPGPCTPDEYAAHRETVREHARSVGRDPDELRYGCMFVMLIVNDEEEHRLVVEHPIMKFNSLITCASATRWTKWGLQHPLGDDWAYMKDFCPQWWERDECLEVIKKVPAEAVEFTNMIGTVDQLEGRLQEYIDAGVDFVIPCPYTPGAVEGDTGRFGDEPNANELWNMLRRLKEHNNRPEPAMAI